MAGTRSQTDEMNTADKHQIQMIFNVLTQVTCKSTSTSSQVSVVYKTQTCSIQYPACSTVQYVHAHEQVLVETGGYGGTSV